MEKIMEEDGYIDQGWEEVDYVELEREALDALGDLTDPSGFRDWLYDRIDEGDFWEGYAGEERACPIREYLVDALGTEDVYVGGGDIAVTDGVEIHADEDDWTCRFVGGIDYIGEARYPNFKTTDMRSPVTVFDSLKVLQGISRKKK